IIDTLKNHLNLEGIRLNSTSYTSYYNGVKGKFWAAYWYSPEGVMNLSAVVNAENGEVLEVLYYKNKDYEPIPEISTLEIAEDLKENVVNQEDILKLANGKVQKMFPKTKGQLKLEIKSEDNIYKDQVHISSYRYIN